MHASTITITLLAAVLLVVLPDIQAAPAGIQIGRRPSYPRGNRPNTTHTSQKQPPPLTFGAIFPETALTSTQRRYHLKLQDGLNALTKGRAASNMQFPHKFSIQTMAVRMALHPTPREILNRICDDLLKADVSAVLYLTNAVDFGSNAASVQYLLQLLGYLGLPVIAWNADNIGLDQRVSSQASVLQLAPSLEHQVSAAFAVLLRYGWFQFGIVTTQLGGHEDFVRAVRNKQHDVRPRSRFVILTVKTLRGRTRDELRAELEPLATGEARVLLLFAGKDEARDVFAAAHDVHITGRNFIWIVTQSVIGAVPSLAPPEFPAGLIGIHYNTTLNKLFDEIERAVLVFGHGLELHVNDPANANISLDPGLRCNDTRRAHWQHGERFYKYLRNVSIETKGGPNIEFLPDGTLKYVELDVLNLGKDGFWERIGGWTESGLEIKDIVWPGGALVPPKGVPEKFNLKVTFLDERPFVSIGQPDNETGECESSRAVKCRVAPESAMAGMNESMAKKNTTIYKCCMGFCIDLLHKFAQDLGFTYDIYRVEDGHWGVMNNGTWNGLIAELLEHHADIVVTSIKINRERQTAADFTVPFLETGIAIVVAKRTGIISPKAFLEPFDTVSWLLILLVSIQVAAFSIFVFEWLSPSGYDMHITPPREHRFSLFRTYWLVWAILFGAAVDVDCPRGYTSRFMSNVWAMFAVVFLAIYTANLAAFMITREEYYNLIGIEDFRLQNPTRIEPPFRFGTIPHGNTEAVLKINKPRLYNYMRKFNRSTVIEGIRAVKTGELDAFVYDATVLDYLVGQDDECRLLTVGSWYAMTGYGFALPKGSKYLKMFNKQMIEYREKGDLERLQRFWLQGACKPDKPKRNASNPLDADQFMSAFLLLGCGVLLTLALLVMEHIYFRYIRKQITGNARCLALVSLSMGKSLSFRDAVNEARDMLKQHHRCRDPVCDAQLWRMKHELELARHRVRHLEGQLRVRVGPEELLRPRDLTRNQVTSNELTRAPSPRRPAPAPFQREITEKETVL
ncbi:glutamate receptor ionotropic, NMDA 2B-like [Ornithodoros turicata]|uniref:glutamate receptor ionotropic, NMDA 2B-like n=1 Tax=Ornithodoros turicata TaxID=34597 RepID=UPI00313978BB